MDIASQLDSIKVANFNAKLNCELDYMKNVGIMTPFNNDSDSDTEITVENRILLLEKIIKQPGIHQNSVQQQRDTMFKEIDEATNKNVYKKQWNKLKAFHKTVKLKEYLNANIKDKKIAEMLLKELSKHAMEGNINTKKYVIYDPNEEKILSLPCVKVIKTEKGETYKVDVV